jgi:putative ABC transport system ATP-binding protein
MYTDMPEHDQRRLAQQLAEKVGLGHRLRHRPVELSGGEMQRVAIARALANSPVIMLADEPTGNLDTHTGKEIMDLVRDVWKGGGTLLMVTHDEHIAGQAPRRIHMVDGEVVSDERTA